MVITENTLKSVAFPTLDEAQIAQAAGCIKVAPAHHADGETLFKAGDRAVKFYIVKSGAIDIIDCTGDEPKTLVTHGPGQFSGDISHLTGMPAMVSAVTRGESELFEVAPEALRQILNQCPGLSDIILQAFIARRQLLRESPDFTGLRVIGSRYSPDTFRVRDFLSRNRVLFTWIDIETDPEVDKIAQGIRYYGGRYAGGRLRAHAAAAQPRQPDPGGSDWHPSAFDARRFTI